MVKDIRADDYPWESYHPHELTAVDGTLFFVAYDETYGRELWKAEMPRRSLLRSAEVTRLDPLTPAREALLPLTPIAHRYLVEPTSGGTDPDAGILDDVVFDTDRVLSFAKAGDLYVAAMPSIARPQG